MRNLREITGTVEELELALAAEIKDAQSGDPLTPVGVLIGGTLQRPYLQRRVAEINEGLVNVRFFTPSDLALAVAEKQRIVAGELPLPPMADRVLLREIAVEHTGYFEGVREMGGFSEALFQVFRELRQAGHDEVSLADLLGKSCETAEKGAALAELFSTFIERRRGFYGADDCLAAPSEIEIPFSALLAYGLTDPSQAVRDLLELIAESCPVAVLLPKLEGTAAAGLAELDAWLNGQVESSSTAPALKNSPPPSDLNATRSRLFLERRSSRSGGTKGDGSLLIASTPDPHREVREAVRQALAWAADGIGFHEMAITYREAELYRPIIEAVLNEARIPAYLHEGTPISERPLGRRVVALLDLIEGDLGRREVMDFLADANLPDETRERYAASAPRWDQLSKQAGVVGGLQDWQERLTAFATDLRADDREWKQAEADRADQLREFVTQLAADLADHSRVAGWRAHLGSLRQLLSTYVDGHEQILEPLNGLDRFESLDEETTFERFIEVVRNAIETLRSDEVLGQRPGAFGLRGINVLDTNSLQFLSFRAVAILGISERSFPPPPRQTPLLLDHERRRLTEAGGKRVPQRAFGPDTEPLQFRLATEAARERLLVSYPRKGSEGGKPKLPSYFLRAVAEAATGERVDAEHLPSQLAGSPIYRHAAGSRIGADEPANAISAAERDRTIVERSPALGEAVLAAAEPRLAWARQARDARDGNSLTPYDGVLSARGREHLDQILSGHFSPSSLEGYASCPHKYLLGNVLGVRRHEEPEAAVRIDPRDRGTLLHRILERFMAEDPDAGQVRVQGKREPQRLLQIAEQEFELCVERGETGYPLFWAYDKEELREDLRRWLDSERADERAAALTEGAYEVRFGFRAHGNDDSPLSTDEPLKITAEGVELKIAGKIDRLNWAAGEGFRVVDYKGGRPSSEFKDGSLLLGGRAVQLPLYQLIAAELLGMKASDGDAEYQYGTRRGNYDRRRFTGATMAERRPDVERLLAGIATAVRAGELLRDPKDERTCGWCDFDSVCPTGRSRQIDRKSKAAAAKRFAALREIQ